MSDLLPPEITNRIAAIDREIAEHRANQEHCQKRIEIDALAIERLEFGKRAYLDAAEILRRSCPGCDPSAASDNADDTEEAAGPPSEKAGRRERRDVRGMVRDLLKGHEMPIRDICATLDIRPAQAENAVAWLRARGDLAEAQDVPGYTQAKNMTSLNALYPQPGGVCPSPEERIAAAVISSGKPVPAPTVPEKTADEVLHFLRRCGDMGAGEAQLRIVNAPSRALADLAERGLAHLGDDERWYAESVENDENGAELLDATPSTADTDRAEEVLEAPSPSPGHREKEPHNGC